MLVIDFKFKSGHATTKSSFVLLFFDLACNLTFIKEFRYLMMRPFFNRNWVGACRGRWAGPGLLAGWDAGFRIVGAEIGSLLRR